MTKSGKNGEMVLLRRIYPVSAKRLDGPPNTLTRSQVNEYNDRKRFTNFSGIHYRRKTLNTAVWSTESKIPFMPRKNDRRATACFMYQVHGVVDATVDSKKAKYVIAAVTLANQRKNSLAL